ncbi:hypothetical protein IRJ41_024436, partial [Triplophysa rosa]
VSIRTLRARPSAVSQQSRVSRCGSCSGSTGARARENASVCFPWIYRSQQIHRHARDSPVILECPVREEVLRWTD